MNLTWNRVIWPASLQGRLLRPEAPENLLQERDTEDIRVAAQVNPAACGYRASILSILKITGRNQSVQPAIVTPRCFIQG
mgnify:CR=1 FL=1